MKKKNLLLTGTLLSILTSSALATPSTKTPVKDKSLQAAVNDDWAVLGAPTLYATEMPTSSTICMNTQNSNIGNSPQAGFNFSSQASNSDLSGSLNLGLGAKGLDLYSFTVGANSSFAASTKNTNYTLNFIYLYTYSTKAVLNTTFGDENLSSAGQNALKAGESAFFHTCGDSYVSNLDAGVVLAVNVSVSFKTKQDAYEFKADADLSGVALPTILPTIEAKINKSSNSATISVAALQNGGMPEKLQTIFANPETGNYNSTTCSTNAPEKCELIVNSILAYSATLASQVKDNNGMILNNLYFFNPIINSYSSAGITVPNPKPLSAATLAAQDAIFEQLNISQNRISFLSSYQQHSLPIQPDVKSYIASQTKNLQNRVNYINTKAADCFNANAETCPTIVTQISNTFKNSPSRYGFDKANYAELTDDAWYYVYNNTMTYLVPVSLGKSIQIFATLTTDTQGNTKATNKQAQAYYAKEQGKNYVSQFIVPYKVLGFDATYKCLPAANDSKFSPTRNFTCKDGLVSFDMQFVKSVNPI